MEKISNEMDRETKTSRWFLVDNMRYNSHLGKLQHKVTPIPLLLFL